MNTRPFRFAVPAIATCLALHLASDPASAATYFVSLCGQDFWAGVSVNCVGPLGPKRTIQAAINVASSGDTVMVMPGAYFETIDFNGKEITVKGAAGPATTIIDGGGDGPIVLCNSFEGPGTTLEGFTIRNGFNEDTNGAGMVVALATVSVSNCIFEDNFADAPVAGAGLASLSANLTVTNCQFIDNFAWTAGGMIVWGGNATVTNCSFDGNDGGNRGGGMYIYQADVEIADSEFINGRVGAWDAAGAGLYIEEATVTMDGCTISDNLPFRGTAGIHVVSGSELSLNDCDFDNNQAETPQAYGNAIYLDDSSVTATACNFTNNTGGDLGGAIYAITSTIEVFGCQFSGNQTDGAAGAVYGGDTDITATFCGFLNNHADGDGGAIVVSGISSLTASLCTFAGNSSDHWRGGAIAANYQAPVVLTSCNFSNNVIGPFGKGGALFQMGGSLQVTSCVFDGNSGPEGGAVNLFDLDGEARFENCTFTDNQALAGDGGAIRLANADLEISGGDFENNEATARGGAVCVIHDGDDTSVEILNAEFSGNTAVLGGGALCSNAPTTIVGGGFVNNSADNAGAIAMIGPFGQARIEASRFDGNVVDHAGSAIMVGAFSPGGGATMMNCIVSNNTSGFGGGAIHESVLGAHLQITNCAIVDNHGGGLIINNGASTSKLANSIVWANTGGQGVGGIMPDVRNCNVQGGAIGTESISANPQFVNVATGNYNLVSGSPCIDAGTNQWVPLDALDLDSDGDTEEYTPLDFDGGPRFANDPATVDNGCGGQALVDMGPYEHDGVAIPELRPADINADGVVNVGDLLAVISEWGLCQSACCPADINHDGVVNMIDLLEVIANWG